MGFVDFSSVFMASGLGLYTWGLMSFTNTLVTLAIVFTFKLMAKSGGKPDAPGPNPWPVLGSLHLMDGFRVRPTATA